MSKPEQTKYPPGIYLEIYPARDDVEFADDANGLHAYLVYRTPEGEELVLRGGQPTVANQGRFKARTFGLLGGHIEVETGKLSESIDSNDGRYRPHRMVIPVETGAYDAVLWEAAKARVEEIGKQNYPYDVTASAQLFTSGAQNSNSVVAAALREMGINPLDIIPDDLIPHLPGIKNDLTHGPNESAPTGDSLTTPRTNRPKPKPLNTDLLDKERQLREKREEGERKQREDQDLRLPSLEQERQRDIVEVQPAPEPSPQPREHDGSPHKAEAAKLEQAVRTPPDPLESALLSDPARWNHAQLMTVMKSDDYWTALKPRSGVARAKVTKAFETLTERSAPANRATLVQPAEMPEAPAEPTARGGEALKSAQTRYAASLGKMANRAGPTPAVKAAQTALNRFGPKSATQPEPLKTDGDFGPKTQAATRRALHEFGEPELTGETARALDEELDIAGSASIGSAVGAGFQPEIPA